MKKSVKIIVSFLSIFAILTSTVAPVYAEESIGQIEESVDEPVEEHQHDLAYSDNQDGTHLVYCRDGGCDYEEIEEHSFDENGMCVCGLCETEYVEELPEETYEAAEQTEYECFDNFDGTHTKHCLNEEAGEDDVIEEHTFEDGVCVCGAQEETEEFAEERELTAECNGREFVAVGNIPENAELVVSEESVEEAQQNVLYQEMYNYVVCEAYDIKIVADGGEWQPEDIGVSVSVRNICPITNIFDGVDAINSDPVVLHVDDENNIEELSCNINNEEADIQTVDFETTGFSTFYIARSVYSSSDAVSAYSGGDFDVLLFYKNGIDYTDGWVVCFDAPSPGAVISDSWTDLGIAVYGDVVEAAFSRNISEVDGNVFVNYPAIKTVSFPRSITRLGSVTGGSYYFDCVNISTIILNGVCLTEDCSLNQTFYDASANSLSALQNDKTYNVAINRGLPGIEATWDIADRAPYNAVQAKLVYYNGYDASAGYTLIFNTLNSAGSGVCPQDYISTPPWAEYDVVAVIMNNTYFSHGLLKGLDHYTLKISSTKGLTPTYDRYTDTSSLYFGSGSPDVVVLDNVDIDNLTKYGIKLPGSGYYASGYYSQSDVLAPITSIFDRGPEWKTTLYKNIEDVPAEPVLGSWNIGKDDPTDVVAELKYADPLDQIYMYGTNGGGVRLEIVGNGEMQDYSLSSPAPWSETISVGHVVADSTDFRGIYIGPGITYIGAYAFKGKSIDSIGSIYSKKTDTLGVRRIGRYAFANCGSKQSSGGSSYIGTNAAVWVNVEVIEDHAFYGSKINDVLGAQSPHLTTIGESAFQNCTQLMSQSNSRDYRSLESVGDNAFNGSSITGINLSSPNLKHIGNYAFYNCELSSCNLSHSVESIGDYAFVGGRFTTMTLPYSLETIGDYAFSGVPLATINQTISPAPSLESIGAYAFQNTKLTSLAIPDTTTTIGSKAFYGVNTLTTINGGKNLASIGANAFQAASPYSSSNKLGTMIAAGSSALGAYNWAGDYRNPTFESPLCVIDGVAYWASGATYKNVISSSETPKPGCYYFGEPSEENNWTNDVCVVYGDSWINPNGGVTTLCYSGVTQPYTYNMNAPDYTWDIKRIVFYNTASIFNHLPEPDSGELYYYNLERITLCDGMMLDENASLAYCSVLRTVDLPESITEIPAYFYGGYGENETGANTSKVTFNKFPIAGITLADYLDNPETIGAYAFFVEYPRIFVDESGDEVYRDTDIALFPRTISSTEHFATVTNESAFVDGMKIKHDRITDWADRDDWVIIDAPRTYTASLTETACGCDPLVITVKHKEDFVSSFYNYNGDKIADIDCHTGVPMAVPVPGTDFDLTVEGKNTTFLGWKRSADRQIYSNTEIKNENFFEDQVFTAQFGSRDELKEYTVTFVNARTDEVIDQQTYHYGDALTNIPTLLPYSVGGKTYTFSDWEPVINETVTQDITYRANTTVRQNGDTIHLLYPDGTPYTTVERRGGSLCDLIYEFGDIWDGRPTTYAAISAVMTGHYTFSNRTCGFTNTSTGEFLSCEEMDDDENALPWDPTNPVDYEFRITFCDPEPGNEGGTLKLRDIDDNIFGTCTFDKDSDGLVIVYPLRGFEGVPEAPSIHPDTGELFSKVLITEGPDGVGYYAGSTVIVNSPSCKYCVYIRSDGFLSTRTSYEAYPIYESRLDEIELCEGYIYNPDRTLYSSISLDDGGGGIPLDGVATLYLWDYPTGTRKIRGKTYNYSGDMCVLDDGLNVIATLTPECVDIDNNEYSIDLSVVDWSRLRDPSNYTSLLLMYDATFVSEDRYTVRFEAPNGEVYAEYKDLAHGATIKAPAVVRPPQSYRYDYEFIEWSPDFRTNVTANRTYVAKFVKTAKTLESTYSVQLPAGQNLTVENGTMHGEFDVHVWIDSPGEDYKYFVDVTAPASLTLTGSTPSNTCVVGITQDKTRFNVDNMTQVIDNTSEPGEEIPIQKWSGKSKVSISGTAPTASDTYNGDLTFTFESWLAP